MKATEIIQVWDLPTRLFHWSLVALVVLAWYFVKQADMNAHALCGQWILVLILFRMVWGVIGGETARFARFVRGPGAAIAYLRGLFGGQKSHEVGHNPAGAFMILALLFATGAQATIGLFTKEDDFSYFDAPLAHWITSPQAEFLTQIHRDWAGMLLLLVAIHVVVNLIYLIWLKENLIRPMITGFKAVEVETVKHGPRLGNIWLGLTVLMISSGIVFGGLKFAVLQSADLSPANPQEVAQEVDDWE
ncbi:MAG: cytochrome b/b6 domain-containing protein [Magnetococcales bacterium]|nr:cytochrome b/b6 domain-containing protein [Magnetococcales bacterium]